MPKETAGNGSRELAMLKILPLFRSSPCKHLLMEALLIAFLQEIFQDSSAPATTGGFACSLVVGKRPNQKPPVVWEYFKESSDASLSHVPSAADVSFCFGCH